VPGLAPTLRLQPGAEFPVSGCDRAAGGSGEVNLASHSKRKASRFCSIQPIRLFRLNTDGALKCAATKAYA